MKQSRTALIIVFLFSVCATAFFQGLRPENEGWSLVRTRSIANASSVRQLQILTDLAAGDETYGRPGLSHHEVLTLVQSMAAETALSLEVSRMAAFSMLPPPVRFGVERDIDFLEPWVRLIAEKDDLQGLQSVNTVFRLWDTSPGNPEGPTLGEHLFIRLAQEAPVIQKLRENGFDLERIRTKMLSSVSPANLQKYPSLLARKNRQGGSVEGTSKAMAGKSELKDLSPCLPMLLEDVYQTEQFCSFVFETLNTDIPQSTKTNAPEYRMQKNIGSCIFAVRATLFEKSVVNAQVIRTHTLPSSEVEIIYLAGGQEPNGGLQTRASKYPLYDFFKMATNHCKGISVSVNKQNRNGEMSKHLFTFGEEHRNPSFLEMEPIKESSR